MSQNVPHESAVRQVAGEALFVNDIPVNEELLTGYVYWSRYAHANIKSYNIKKALALHGVHAILSAKDIPGDNQVGPVFHDEPCLADGEVINIGQAIFIIAADNRDTAIEAAGLIEIEYEPLEAILDIETSIAKDNRIASDRKIERGNVETALDSSPFRLKGEFRSGAQEHWYLETQTALCIPGEGNEIKVLSSTQNPSETQAIVSHVLGIPKNEVTVEVRRLGGGFGGKETQGNNVAAWCALLSIATGKPVKIHLFRDDDQIITGKRHRFLSKYEIGFDSNGVIQAYNLELNSDAGSAADLSMAILERAMLHADNSYYIPNIKVIGRAWKTNLPSNTAFRGFGGPQGMAVIENAIDRIARFLKKDPAEIRHINFYQKESNNVTHYQETVENNHLLLIYDKILNSSDYINRKKLVDKFNSENEFYKKGISLTPVKFGISFTTAFLNQAGALVNIYQDGTVLVNHGGTEMGQGLYTKMQCVAAAELGISLDKVKVNATDTSKIPNTSATAASSGSDINGMAVKNAVDILKSRLTPEAVNIFNENLTDAQTKAENIKFENDFIFDDEHKNKKISFADLITRAYLNQVSLSSTGFYKTPGIWFDREKGIGKPFHYFSFSMAVSEVLVDVLTGAMQILRTDIVQDVGNSINEGIDMGQITGGFVQGAGWCTTEDIKWDKNGNLLNHSPDTYKIPSVQDIPVDFRVEILKNLPNPNTIRSSKAIGEPPLMLSLSVWFAIKDAISSVAGHSLEPELSIPATNEAIVLSIEDLKSRC